MMNSLTLSEQKASKSLKCSISCEQCSTQFFPKTERSRFCSSRCSGIAKRGVCKETYADRNCILCYAQFSGHKRSKYCSLKCRNYGQTDDAAGFIRHLLSRWTRKRLTEAHVLGLFEKQQGCCALSGVKMTHNWREGRSSETNISIDRIDSSQGYVDGNTQLVCLFANKMKSNMDVQTFQAWCVLIAGKADLRL